MRLTQSIQKDMAWNTGSMQLRGCALARSDATTSHFWWAKCEMDMWTNEHAENIFSEATAHKQNVRLSQKKIHQNTSITATLNKAAATSGLPKFAKETLPSLGVAPPFFSTWEVLRHRPHISKRSEVKLCKIMSNAWNIYVHACFDNMYRQRSYLRLSQISLLYT